MNSYNNLDPSLFHCHDALTMPQHDVSQEYPRQVHQEMMQNYSTYHQPPGAESLPRRHTEIGEQPSRMLNAQTDESNYPSSPSRSSSLSPSHSYALRVPVSELRQLPVSQLSSYAPNSTSRNPPYTHIRPNSQPPPTHTTILGDSPYTNAPQIPSPLSSATTTITPVGVNIPLLPLPGSLRRYSDTDVQAVQNAHDDLSVYGTANQTIYPSLPESSGFSPEAEFTDPTPGRAHGADSFALVNVDDPFPLSTSPDSTDESAGSMFSGPPPSSIFTPCSTPPSHIPDHHHHHHMSHHYPQATTSSSSRMPERTQRRNGRRRSEPPRDQKATNRLSDQRRLDDEHTEALYKLFVPPGAEVKWKKDRLGIILHYATRLVERYSRLVEYCENTRDSREQMLAQSDEGLRQDQEQLFGRHDELMRQADHWVSTNNSLDRALTNGDGMHHQHLVMNGQHDTARL